MGGVINSSERDDDFSLDELRCPRCGCGCAPDDVLQWPRDRRGRRSWWGKTGRAICPHCGLGYRFRVTEEPDEPELP